MPLDSPTDAYPPPAIEYAPAPPRTRKWMWRGAMLCLTLVALFAGVRYGPRAWMQVQVLYWQRQCMSFTLPPDRVVYEEEPSAAAKLLGDSRYIRGTIGRQYTGTSASIPIVYAAFQPACGMEFQKLLSLWPTKIATAGSTVPAILFLHELKTPSNQRRLVIITYSPESGTFSPSFIQGYNCMPLVIVPGTLTKLPASVFRGYSIDVMSGWPSKPPDVRIFGGQPDPDDLSHFTIRYQIWGQEDVIDGRIDDQDNVTLTQRKIPEFPRQR